MRRLGGISGTLTSSGRIALQGEEFESPSTAARRAAGGAAINGWLAWYVREGDQWVSLAVVRDRALAES